MATAGKSTPQIADEIDKFYLNPVWLTANQAEQTTSVVGPSSKGSGGDPGSGGAGDPGSVEERPQVDDIQRPVTQEVYYVNNVARVKVKMRIYISATDPVKKFKVTSTIPVAKGGRS